MTERYYVWFLLRVLGFILENKKKGRDFKCWYVIGNVHWDVIIHYRIMLKHAQTDTKTTIERHAVVRMLVFLYVDVRNPLEKFVTACLHVATNAVVWTGGPEWSGRRRWDYVLVDDNSRASSVCCPSQRWRWNTISSTTSVHCTCADSHEEMHRRRR